MPDNLFLLDKEEYTRDMDLVKQYIEQSASYISSMKGMPIEEAKQKVIAYIKQNNVFRDPDIEVYERANYEDKHRKIMKLSKFHQDVKKRNLILAPTYTAYTSRKEMVSKLEVQLAKKKKERSILKKEALKAKMEGNKNLFAIKNAGQDNKKRFSNAMSGAFGQKASFLYNETGHSTLTSIVRTESSVSNASNEKCISGNRYYPNVETILNNLISICSIADIELIRKCVSQFNLHYPTVEEVHDCILYSHRLYVVCQKSYEKIKEYVAKLTPEQRFSFVYVGDLYHFRKHNEEVTKDFLDGLIVKSSSDSLNALDEVYRFDEAIVNLACYVCFEEVKGYKSRADIPLESQQKLLGTCQNIQATLEKYKDLIKCLFLTKNIPSSTAFIKTQPRKAVVLSDTDSTMFSVDEWVKWRYGSHAFTPASISTAASVMYIATQCMAHQLAIFSANMGVSSDLVFSIQMKPEYFFPVFGQTPVAKHYFTFKVVQEGNVFAKPDFEIKGVHMKNSALPMSVREDSTKQMKDILMCLYENKKVDLSTQLKHTAELETKIYNSVLIGEINYYKAMNIRKKTAYKAGPLQSNYAYHQLWLDVFEPFYGSIADPDYKSVKIPLTTDTARKTNRWLESQPEEFRKRMLKWMEKHNKDKLPTIYINRSKAENIGVPKEIIPVIDVRRVVLDMTLSHRIILATLGYFPKENWMVKELISF